MKLLIIGHKYQYEMLKLTQIFYPNTKIDLLFSSADTGDEPQQASHVPVPPQEKRAHMAPAGHSGQLDERVSP